MASKTISSPAVPDPGGVVAERDVAAGFVQSSILDAIEVMYRTGFCRPALYWVAERQGLSQADVSVRLAAVDAEATPVLTPVLGGKKK